MYTAHFGLNAPPFSITPDPYYLYLSVRHREALAHLLYGVNEGPGFVLLTGEVGTGKTTLCRSLIEQLPDTVDVALLLNPSLLPIELLAALFDELRISYDIENYTLKDFINKLTSYLLTAHAVGRRTVLILDEAQNLTTEVLEQVRLLTNLETASQKLLQIILVGQPELNRLLKRNNLRQLAQRITARYHLLPLSLKDTQAYINHRLELSGAHLPLFSDAAMRVVYRHSGGVPRLINVICDRALLGGYVNNENQIDTKIVSQAIEEVRGEDVSHSSPLISWSFSGLLAIVLLVGGLIWWLIPQVFHSTTVSNDSPLPPVTLSADSQSSSNLSSLSPPVVSTEAPKTPFEQTSIETPSPPPPAVSLLSILQSTDTKSAFISIFRLWNEDYTSLAGETVCQRAATIGFACISGNGSWDDLRRFNRPVVIELITGENTQHHLVVTRLQDELVTLAVSGQTVDIPINEINELWEGQFLLLWHPPDLPIPVMKVGIRNKAVVWIRKHLRNIEGRRNKAKRLSSYFDYALKRRIIAFQRQQNLKPDGVVGEQTMLALQALSGEEPLLLLSTEVDDN